MTDQAIYCERRMLAKMILVAMQDLGLPGESMGGARAVLRDAARAWFMSTRHCEDLGSFEWVCAHLGLEVSWVRKAVTTGTYNNQTPFTELIERLEAFAEGEDISIGQVARESGVPVGTLYTMLKSPPRQSSYAPILEHYLERVAQVS